MPKGRYSKPQPYSTPPFALHEGAALHEKASGSVHRGGGVSARVPVTEPPAKRRADYYGTARKGGRRAEKQCVRTADSEFDYRKCVAEESASAVFVRKFRGAGNNSSAGACGGGERGV